MANPRAKLITLLAEEMFSSSSSSSEDEIEDELLLMTIGLGLPTNERLPRIEDYVETVVPRYSPAAFKEHFRLDPATFEHVLERIAPSICNVSVECSGRPTITPTKQLLLALWYFATPDSYRSLVDRFDVGRATAVRTVRRVTSALFDMAPIEIVWPLGAKAQQVVAGFQAMNGFPGVIGAVDGSHIPIPAPKVNALSYYNRKGFHSIVLQAICDNEGKMTHCYAGEVGSVHDARVFRLSEVQSFIDNESNVKFAGNTHLVGDPAYVCQPELMVPFKDNGHLTARQKNYNFCLSSTRCIIERAFAQLKGRFRCLKYLDMSDVKEIPKVIIACCVLHNICISRGDETEIEISQDSEDASVDDIQDDIRGRNGNMKRIEIANMLPIRQRQ